MKKRNYCFFLPLTLLFAACCPEPTPGPILKTEDLVGTWVYDCQEENTRESITFTATGMLYYHSITSGIESSGSGRYFLGEDNCITGTYTISGRNYNLNMTAVDFNEYRIRFLFNDLGFEYEYAKLLTEVELDYGETLVPNYDSYVNHPILSYFSHEDKIAQVDAKTGKITAMSEGVTYVDVVTELGTAVIKVSVKGLFDDYALLIGKTKDEVKDIYGNPYKEDAESVAYMNESTIMLTYFSRVTGLADCVCCAISHLTLEEKKEYLANKYYTYPQGCDNEQIAYVNAESFEEATVGIILYTETEYIYYVAIEHDLFEDFSYGLGKTAEEIKYMYEDRTLFHEDETCLAYMVTDGYIDFVQFRFESYKTVQYVALMVNNLADQEEILEFLNTKYISLPEYSTDEDLYFTDAKNLMTIVYWPLEHMIVYCLNDESLQVASRRIEKVEELRLEKLTSIYVNLPSDKSLRTPLDKFPFEY